MLMISGFQNPNPGPHAIELQNNVEKLKKKTIFKSHVKRQTFCKNNCKAFIVRIFQWLYIYIPLQGCHEFLVISFIKLVHVNVYVDLLVITRIAGTL